MFYSKKHYKSIFYCQSLTKTTTKAGGALSWFGVGVTILVAGFMGVSAPCEQVVVRQRCFLGTYF